MKKILIFYASFGGGHLSAANSIKQCIDENFEGYETSLVDCLLYVNKPINKISTIAYKEMAKKFPWAWARFIATRREDLWHTLALLLII